MPCLMRLASVYKNKTLKDNLMIRKYILLAATLFLLQGWLLAQPVSLHSLQLNKLSGGTLALSEYSGKKVLLVNIATGGQYAAQLAELEAFYQTHKDSIVVIGFPSNSFGNETHTDEELSQLLGSIYGISFPLAAIAPVAGAGTSAVFGWITDKESNGVFQSAVQGDFQKYLVNGSGRPIGIFMSRVSVTSSEFLDSIVY
jgi:glutathione peroxidase